MPWNTLSDLSSALAPGIILHGGEVRVTDPAAFRSALVDDLAYHAVFAESPDVRETARWVIWEASQALGCPSASIQELYMARGRGEVRGFTVPAVNIRGLAYEFARTIFRVAHRLHAGPFVFELAKSEMGYTFQRPAEYAAVVLAAALKEGHRGPVFIQGDHFQANARKFSEDPRREIQGLKDLIEEAIAAGFFNIDVDTSTLVDLSKAAVLEQQRANFESGAVLTGHIRRHQPAGLAISVGGEIGEVGGKNSTVDELRAYVDGLNTVLDGTLSISKVSVQTGTSHGGVPTPDGKVAPVRLDLRVLEELSEIARRKYGMAGAVQHGASTLPEDLFHHFPSVETAEIHLATGFQNLILDHPAFPADLKARMYAWLREHCADERAAGMTDEQFYYKARKKAWGPFKREIWMLPAAPKQAILADLEAMLTTIFANLAVTDTEEMVAKHVVPTALHRPQPVPIPT